LSETVCDESKPGKLDTTREGITKIRQQSLGPGARSSRNPGARSNRIKGAASSESACYVYELTEQLAAIQFGAGLTADGLRTLPTWRAMSCGRSTRILENHDIHRWITLRWPDPPLVLDGPMDGEAFLAYVERLLAPSLRPGGRLSRTHSDDNRVRSPPAVIKASLSECFHGPLSGQVVHDNGASMSRSPLFRSEGMPIPL
jgi:hypothetical protein